MRRAIALAAVLLGLAGCGGEDEPEPTAPDRFDAERAFADLEAQVEIGPRPSGSPGAEETAELIAARLTEAGATGVRVQRPWANVVATIPGEGDGVVVVGAHYDTKDGIPGFVGANDGASGVAVVLELARALAAGEPPASTIALALFDAEEARGNRDFSEDGTRGSRQYVDYAAASRQGAPALESIDAMILFDLVGDCDLQIPREAGSDPALYAEFAEAARELSPAGSAAPFEGEASTVLDDHIPFLEAGIPAVDLIDFSYGPGGTPGEYWHTPEDTLDKVCAESLEAVGEPAALALGRIGAGDPPE